MTALSSTPAAAVTSYRRALRALLLARLRGQRNRLLRGSGARGRAALMVLALSASAVFAFYFSSWLGRITLANRPDLERASLAGIITPFLFVLLLSEVGAIIHHLYVASDLDLLQATPLPVSVLFVVKLADIGITAILPILLMAAALLGWGNGAGANAAFAVLALLTTLLLALFATSLSAVVVMLVMRVLPAGRLRGVFTFLAAAFGGLFWLGTQALRSDNVANALPKFAPWLDRTGLTGGWSPPALATDMLLAARAGDTLKMAGDLLLLALLAAVTTATGAMVFRFTFTVSRGRAQEATPGRAFERLLTPHTKPLRRPALLPTGPAMAIARKDLRVFRRDPRLLGSLTYPIAMAGFFTWQLTNSRLSDEVAGGGFWLGLATLPLMVWFLGSIVATPAMAREGKQAPLLKLMPATWMQLVLGKWLGALALPLALALVMTIGLALWQRPPPAHVLMAIPAAVLLAALETLACLAAGLLAPRFDEENPNRQAGCAGTVTGFLLTIVNGGALTAIVAWLLLLASGSFDISLPVALIVSIVLLAVQLLGMLLLVLVLVQARRHWEGWQMEG